MKTFQSLYEFPALVGREVAVSDWLTITQEQVNQFAQATGDHQWIHVDVEKARAGPSARKMPAASTDNTPEVARNYAGFVEYQRNEYNLGAGGAWRRGVERATGKYILKLDADDEWLPGFHDEIERAFEASPEAAIAITSVMVRHEATGQLNLDIICDEDTRLDPDEFRSLLLHRFSSACQAAPCADPAWRGTMGRIRSCYRSTIGSTS